MNNKETVSIAILESKIEGMNKRLEKLDSKLDAIVEELKVNNDKYVNKEEMVELKLQISRLNDTSVSRKEATAFGAAIALFITVIVFIANTITKGQ